MANPAPEGSASGESLPDTASIIPNREQSGRLGEAHGPNFARVDNVAGQPGLDDRETSSGAGVTACIIEVSERRTRWNQARWIRGILMECHSQAERFWLVLKNLDKRGIEMLYPS